MLKHASPLRSSPGQPQPEPSVTPEDDAPSPAAHLLDSYSERGVDCDSLVVPASFAQAEKAAGYQVGTWSGVSQASVRRGLSFSARRAPDALSFRSVRSEGLTIIPKASELSSSTSMTNVATLRREEDAARGDERGMPCFKGDMASLKSILRLPGVRGHARVIEVTKDGILLSPETLSLNSADSFFFANSGRTSSRSWSSNASSNSSATNASSGSNSSTSEPASTTIRVFAKCLRSDIEYKTISVNTRASCREVVALLLSKYRMRHRDPNLFYLTMEVTVRRCSGAQVRSLLVLEEGARPAQLALCRPPGDSRFALQMRRGGVVKIHDTVLMPGSQYKSLLVSDRTTAEEVVQLLLNCYNRRDNKSYYAIHEVRRSPEFSDRMIQTEERLLEVKARWPRDRQAEFVFVLRRNMAQAFSLRKLSLRTGEEKWAGDGVGETAGGPTISAPPPQSAPRLQAAPPSQPTPYTHPAPPLKSAALSTQVTPYPPPTSHAQVPPHPPQPTPHPEPAVTYPLPTQLPQAAQNLHSVSYPQTSQLAPYSRPHPPSSQPQTSQLAPYSRPHPPSSQPQTSQLAPYSRPHPPSSQPQTSQLAPYSRPHPPSSQPQTSQLAPYSRPHPPSSQPQTSQLAPYSRPHPHSSQHPQPAQHSKRAPPRHPLLEGTVIDCTDVTPKMTTINRAQQAPPAGTTPSSLPTTTPEVFPAKTLASGVPPRPPLPLTAHFPSPPTNQDPPSGTTHAYQHPVAHVPPPPPPPPPTTHVSPPTTNASIPSALAPDTKDSATNTEVKVVSNNSTQTVVSRKGKEVAPPSPTPQNLPPNTLLLCSEPQHLTSDTPSLSSSEHDPFNSPPSPPTNDLPPNYPPPPPPAPSTAESGRLPPPYTPPVSWHQQAGTSTRSTPQGVGAGPQDVGMKDAPVTKHEGHPTLPLTATSAASSTASSLPAATTSPSSATFTTASTTSSSSSSTTGTTMKTETCKHNCQHCFYI